MGAYLNPQSTTKEHWLSMNAREVSRAQAASWSDFNDDLVVCLVHNGLFTAAGIAYDQRELNDWLDQTDPRAKRFFVAPKEKLLEASNLKNYL